MICLWQEGETFEMAITTCTKGTKLTLCFQSRNTQIFSASPYQVLLNQPNNQQKVVKCPGGVASVTSPPPKEPPGIKTVFNLEF